LTGEWPAELFSPLDFNLHCVELIGCDDGRVAVFDVVLGDFTFVDFNFLERKSIVTFF
jgi:hypothetical protein